MSAHSAKVQAMILDEMSRGEYASEDDLLLNALRALRDRREDLQELREAFEDIAAGRTMPADEFDREFRARKGIGELP